MTEFIIVFPVMLLLLFGTLQIALLYQAKIQLNYAAFEAARAGALNNAQQWAMQAGLVRGLVPLHTHGAPVGGSGGLLASGRGWLRWARGKLWSDVQNNMLRIDVINPSENAFSNHGITVEIDGADETVIPNDSLMYRDASSRGGQSIQDANLLKIRVMYCYEMQVPFANRVISSMLRLGNAAAPPGNVTVGAGQMHQWQTTGAAGIIPPADGSFEKWCLELGPSGAVDNWRRHVPIVAQAIARMQSPAIERQVYALPSAAVPAAP